MALVRKLVIAFLSALALFLFTAPAAANAQAQNCEPEQECQPQLDCTVLPPEILTAVQSEPANVQFSFKNSSCPGDYLQNFYLGTVNSETEECQLISSAILISDNITAPLESKTLVAGLDTITKPVDGTEYCVTGETIYGEDQTTGLGNFKAFNFSIPTSVTIVQGSTTETLSDTGATTWLIPLLALILISSTAFIQIRLKNT